MTRLTPERKEELTERANDPHYLNYVGFTGKEVLELLSEIANLKADNRQIWAEREVYKTAAHQWMIQYDKLKDKYEPMEWVTS